MANRFNNWFALAVIMDGNANRRGSVSHPLAHLPRQMHRGVEKMIPLRASGAMIYKC